MKKLILLGMVVVVGLIVLKKTELGSLVRVWVHDGKASLESSISPETRIKQLRNEIARVESRLKKAAVEQTRLEVSYDNLRKEVEALKVTQGQREKDMRAMLNALDADTKLVTFDGKSVDAGDLQTRLDQTTRSYKIDRETLKAREEVLAARKQVVEASDERIQSIRQRQQELVVIVEKVEAQLALLRLKQTANQCAVTGNELGEAERLLDQLNTRLQEEEKLQEVNARYGLTPARKETSRRSLEESKKAALEALDGDE
jgi:chromosome segregation ATPase